MPGFYIVVITSNMAFLATKVSLLIFSQEIAEGLIHANKVTTPDRSRGRPSKRKCWGKCSKKAWRKKTSYSIAGRSCDCLGHWSIPTSDKKRSRLCQEHSRMTCGKCKVHLCQIQNRNYFHDFHTARTLVIFASGVCIIFVVASLVFTTLILEFSYCFTVWTSELVCRCKKYSVMISRFKICKES